MTEIYETNPMPDVLAVKCPKCGGPAEFEFATIVQISERKDIPYFQDSKHFDYHKFRDSSGQNWHGAVYFPAVHGSLEAIKDLPEEYDPKAWAHSKFWRSKHITDWGSLRCSKCSHGSRHHLDWPDDAWYIITHKGQPLWAFNRDSAVEVRDFIASTDRQLNDYEWSKLLLKIPTTFKTKNNRDDIVKKLNKLLASN